MTDNIGEIDSKFRYIIVAAKRTRQLQGGSTPLVKGLSKKFTRIAQEEVAAGMVNFEIVGSEPQDEDEAMPIVVGPVPH
ncbi:MAG: DNA-directed RNA polymerase subunit omega [Acidobacteriota bacterium]|nr:DNA-directed RNA polymerase subunit omega [Acidobacteriota bacterium]